MLLRAAAKRVPVECKYAASGCKDIVLAADREHHASECEYRPFCCPLLFELCRWRGEIRDLVEHLQEEHRSGAWEKALDNKRASSRLMKMTRDARREARREAREVTKLEAHRLENLSLDKEMDIMGLSPSLRTDKTSCNVRSLLVGGIEFLQGSNTQVTVINVRQPPPVEWITVQACLGQHFLVMVQKLVRNGYPQFFGSTKIIGTKDLANQYQFRMTLRRPRKKLSFSTIVRTVRSGNAAIMDRDCLVFDESVAKHFASSNNLTLEVDISPAGG